MHIRYQSDGAEMHLLDESSVIPPAISRTWFVSLVSGLVGRKQPSEQVPEESEEESESGEGDAATTVGRTARPAPAVKAGGRRRKAARTKAGK